MENQNIRIPITIGDDKNICFNLEQEFDTLDVLSLKITASDAYKTTCSDFGSLVGRVVVNGGFGVENAKVSVFIPLSTEDKSRAEILELYPFETVNDQFPNGVRYNTLPRIQQQNPDHIPIGTFPDISDLTHYPTYVEVFEKYYKFTTTTNSSGDYMIFGVPLGPHVVHMDMDLLDTPSFVVSANDLVNELAFGSELASVDQDNPDPNRIPGFIYRGKQIYEVAPNTNLDGMPNIFSENKEINIIPFWGDKESCQLGITRCDFNVDYNYKPNAIFFGTVMSGSGGYTINTEYEVPDDKVRTMKEVYNFASLKVAVWYEGENGFEYFNTYDATAMKESYNDVELTGIFKLYLPMYSDYYITNEFGDIIPSKESGVGIPTKGRYAFEFFETDEQWSGRIIPWGGYSRSLLPGFRVPTSQLGNQWVGGWDRISTNDSIFEYDIENTRQKYYTIATTYNRKNKSTIKQVGDYLGWLPTKQDSNFPLNSEDVYSISDDTTVIGSVIIPRYEMLVSDIPKEPAADTLLTIKIPRNFIQASWTSDTKNSNVQAQEWHLGIGVKPNGINNGEPMSTYYKDNDGDENYLYDYNYERFKDKNTWNYGENSVDGIPNPENIYQIHLTKQLPGGQTANDQGVFPPHSTGTIRSTQTTGPFINASTLNGGISLFTNSVVDVSDDLPELIKGKINTSKGLDLDTYNNRLYYFGKTYSNSGLRVIEDTYNG